MKILKIVLIAIAVIIAIPLIIALFVSKEFSITKETVINRPRQEVFDYIRYVKNQEQYSEWELMDPETKKSYRGTDGTVGFVSTWESEKTGKGEMEITAVLEGEGIDLTLHFIEPFEGYAKAPFRVEALDSTQTRVTWTVSGESRYPMNFMNLFGDATMGDPIQKSLVRLKDILEKQ